MKELTMNDFATKREDEEGSLEKEEEDQCCDEENQLSLEEVFIKFFYVRLGYFLLENIESYLDLK
jgi:hypothetical protein